MTSNVETLAELMREASRRRNECDERNAVAEKMKNKQAAGYFLAAMNAADSDLDAFNDAITRVRAETVEDAGHQLSAAIRLYELVRGSVDFEQDAKRDFAAIGRSLYSAVHALESFLQKDLSAGVREDRLSPWADKRLLEIEATSAAQVA